MSSFILYKATQTDGRLPWMNKTSPCQNCISLKLGGEGKWETADTSVDGNLIKKRLQCLQPLIQTRCN